MQRTEDEYLKNLLKELDKGNNFIDYFVTIGIKEETIFDDFLYQNDISILNESIHITPEIISKFPPIEKTIIGVDENMIKVNIKLFSIAFPMVID
jgi:hypothetical protein